MIWGAYAWRKAHQGYPYPAPVILSVAKHLNARPTKACAATHATPHCHASAAKHDRILSQPPRVHQCKSRWGYYLVNAPNLNSRLIEWLGCFGGLHRVRLEWPRGLWLGGVFGAPQGFDQFMKHACSVSPSRKPEHKQTRCAPRRSLGPWLSGSCAGCAVDGRSRCSLPIRPYSKPRVRLARRT